MATTTYDVTCRYSTQAYTARHNGRGGSSTMSPEAAVLRLATKIHGERARIAVEAIEPCRSGTPGIYRITALIPAPEPTP